jgi:hypothetical protein
MRTIILFAKIWWSCARKSSSNDPLDGTSSQEFRAFLRQVDARIASFESEPAGNLKWSILISECDRICDTV